MTLKDKLLSGEVLVSTSISQTKSGFRVSVKPPRGSLQSRVAELARNAALNHEDVSLILDDSSSMAETEDFSHQKIAYLRDAVAAFADEVDFSASRVFCIPFNSTSFATHTQLQLKGAYITANGGTPMAAALERFGKSTVSRGIMISDGEADSSTEAVEEARHLAQAKKKVDCVHIGSSSGGEKTLKTIAEITGGIYFKFRDLKSFKESLKQLAPKQRLALESKTAEEIKRLTGATEVIK